VGGYANGEPYRLPSPDADSTEQPIEPGDQGYLPRRVEAPSEVVYFVADGPKGLRNRPKNWFRFRSPTQPQRS
jgi:hypothetical protein